MTLPSLFTDLVHAQYRADDAARVIEGSAARRVVSLRANALKAPRDQIAQQLDQAGISWEPVSWYDDAFVLPHARERDVWALSAYEQGMLYLQSLSSMMPALALGARAGEDLCDMCAAPGGKTTQLAALTAGKAPIMACELHAPRAEKLRFNLKRQGVTSATVLTCDARRLDAFLAFDRVLLDAPCSGSGTLRADDPRAAERFTPALLKKVGRAQQALFAKALELLKPGGTLVYSTCSVLRSENEDVVSAGLQRAPRGRRFELRPLDPALFADAPQLPTTLDGTCCVAPSQRYEGFFIARIVRTA
ncbi:RsmB/NOP family class I SAM-dependent RNA methyltransferase [Eggerthellaceae bacterium zg-1084]|uniref:RsmB/NOP family class I SAM-dependent RNA methyltransferase n=1 Tax=Berryella wangjianweii TaxID=2734634 RepID=UPI001553AECC|nr:RsmB/NOP family class I SAM-dependent RNA methyltransferase [Berryella wangjianweii]NPD31002.1 RsmB/NOP family class I SAM-dependent RNA methyltransferase [Berryella wangjianweii]